MSFLKSEWRHLAILNWQVDPALLAVLVPRGTKVDRWRGRAFVSLVGFLFLRTRVLGVPVPFHMNFEEVNLRFYVLREDSRGARRGVVFVKEIVPRSAIAWVARTVYGENYVALPMRHRIEADTIEYGWRLGDRWCGLRVRTEGESLLAPEGSEEEFVTEHYWGYAGSRRGCVEYEVKHPRWRLWRVAESLVEGDLAPLYGPELAAAIRGRPSSAFVAEGSPVTVERGRLLTG